MSRKTADFQKIIYDHFRHSGRDFPWRATHDPYHILVSEVMLQQTQTDRVVKKYPSFISAFPDFYSLKAASFFDVMRLWQGLGYNRRAFFLHQTASIIVKRHSGICPASVGALQSLPGIGEATASAICAFAFNQPVVFIETNIRSVFIHFFFQDKNSVADAQIAPLVKDTLDVDSPRQWYWALMDYGAWLKKTQGNPNRKSRHHHRQTPFLNSSRHIRGAIIKLLTEKQRVTEDFLLSHLPFEKKRTRVHLAQLAKEKLLVQKQGAITL